MDPSPARGRLAVTAEAPYVAALAALAIVLGLAPVTNNDIWLHLLTGDWMLAHGRVPGPEVFSFVAAGRPYVAHEWGSELLLSLLYRSAGLGGLLAYKAISAIVLALGLYAAGRLLGAAPHRAGALVGIGLMVAGAHLWARPHLLSWLALAALLALLQAARRRPRLLLLAPLLQAAWTNLHGGFVLGPGVAAVWAAGEAWRRRRGAEDARPPAVAGAAGAMAVACLLNPYGYHLLLLPFELTGSDTFMQAIYEWQSPLTSAYAGTTMFALFVLLAALWGWSLTTREGRRDPCWLLVLGLLLALALQMNRNVPLFAMAAAPWLAAVLPAAGGRWRSRLRLAPVLTLAGLLAATTMVAAWGYPYGPGRWRPLGLGIGPRAPVAACATLAAIGARGRAYTTYGEGAYVAWRLWPHVTISMDSRNSVYGEDNYKAYDLSLTTAQGLAAWLARWPVDLAVVAHGGPFRRGLQTATGRNADLPHSGLLGQAGLRLIEFDDYTAAYASPSAAEPGRVEALAYRVIHPVLTPSTLPPADRPLALQEARRAVASHPDSLTARWLLGSIAAQAGLEDEAIDQLEEMGRLDLAGVSASWGLEGTVDAARLSLMALLLSRQGSCPQAREKLLQALRSDPGYRPARDLLATLGC